MATLVGYPLPLEGDRLVDGFAVSVNDDEK